MPRQKKTGAVGASSVVEASHTVDATGPAPFPTPSTRPAYIDGPPVNEDGTVAVSEQPAPNNWGDRFKAVLTTATFQMSEDRRFKQRVFKFNEKPADEVIATLKENGFTYRPHKKSWTIPVSAETRLLSDRLAHEFASCVGSQSR
jgi:hypothetical protein